MNSLMATQTKLHPLLLLDEIAPVSNSLGNSRKSLGEEIRNTADRNCSQDNTVLFSLLSSAIALTSSLVAMMTLQANR